MVIIGVVRQKTSKNLTYRQGYWSGLALVPGMTQFFSPVSDA
jgi:hypothetical protein